MTMKKYAIVNDVDRPSEDRVTEIVDGKHFYMRIRKPYLKEHDKMTPTNPVFLEDFGFDIWETDFGVCFKKVRTSTVKYKDGTFRDWQGANEFMLDKVVLI